MSTLDKKCTPNFTQIVTSKPIFFSASHHQLPTHKKQEELIATTRHSNVWIKRKKMCIYVHCFFTSSCMIFKFLLHDLIFILLRFRAKKKMNFYFTSVMFEQIPDWLMINLIDFWDELSMRKIWWVMSVNIND